MMCLLSVVLCTTFLLPQVIFSAEASSSGPVVETKSGKVQGCVTSYKEKSVNLFRKIPFAEPPVNDLRFKKTVPVSPWTGIYNATEKPSPCVQPFMDFGLGFSMNYSDSSEDCLYLSIWQPTPQCSEASPCSVVVYVYGGGFIYGDASLFLYDGLYFSTLNDVVYVTFNYRLGVLGFLDANVPDAPGNMGLFDQLQALRWVKDNIQYFGGDPNSITLFGQSAGAISIGMHLMSPLSKGLFKRAILCSGSPLTLAISKAFSGMGRFYTIAGLFDCFNNSLRWDMQQKEVLQCLRNVDAHEMMDKTYELGTLTATFFPKLGDEFFPDEIDDVDSLSIHASEILIGTTINEGNSIVFGFTWRVPQFLTLLKDNLSTIVRLLLKYFVQVPHSATNRILEAYSNGNEQNLTPEQVKYTLGQSFEDLLFTCPMDLFSEAADRQDISVYQYAFAYRPSFALLPEWVGVAHAEDIPFLLGSAAVSLRNETVIGEREKEYAEKIVATEKEIEFSEEVVKFFGAFAKTGKPKIPTTNEDWPKYTKENPVFVYLQPNNYTKAKGPRTDKCPLWEPYLVKRKTTTPKPGVTTPRPKPTPSKPGKRPKSRLEPEDNFLAVSAGSCPFQSATLLLILSISMYLLKPFS